MNRDGISELINRGLLGFRKTIRRRYLRKEVKHYLKKPYLLTSEQKKELKAFWGKYTKHFSPLWHEMYLQKTGVFDVRFIPDDIMFTDIEGYYNDWDSSHGIDNKCNYSLYIPEAKMPKNIFRKMKSIYHDEEWNIISKEDAIRLCKEEGHVVLKYAVESGRGGGVFFWDEDKNTESELVSIIDSISTDAVAQSVIKQHADICALKNDSVNCIRVMTMATPTGVELVSSYFRMGQGSCRIDYEGGVTAGISEDGKLFKKGVNNQTCQQLEEHASGVRFEDFVVPSYRKVVDKAKELHKKMGDFRIISWDFAVDEAGDPVFIEMNLKYGGTKYHQLVRGPLFGDNTTSILNEVFGGKSRN